MDSWKDRFYEQRFENVQLRLDQERIARELQAVEYARRLVELNHAHAQAQETAHTYVTLDKYEDRVEAVDGALGELQSWRSRATGAGIALMLVWGLVSAGLGVLVSRAIG